MPQRLGAARRLKTRAAPPAPPKTVGPAADAPDLSVCIVNWNCRELLRDCLNSLRQQSLAARHEVIVVDNASTDGAADLVAAEFPEVRLLRNGQNLGFSRGNNQAAAVAAGKHLLFLNNDTVVPPGALHQLVHFLDANPDVAMVGPRLRDARGKRQTSYRRRPTLASFLYRTFLFRAFGLCRARYREYRRDAVPADGPRDVDILLGAAVAVPRELLLHLGGWDEDFTFGGEDMELCHRARRFGRIVHCPEIEITHLGSVSSKQHVAFATPHIAVGFARYFRKTGSSPLALLGYKLVVTADAPLRIVARALHCCWRRWRGRHRQAEKCWREVVGAVAFLKSGLIPFWKA